MLRSAWFLLALSACASGPEIPAGQYEMLDWEILEDDCELLSDTPGHTEVEIGPTVEQQFELSLLVHEGLGYVVPVVPCLMEEMEFSCETGEEVRLYDSDPDYKHTMLHDISGALTETRHAVYLTYARTELCEGCNQNAEPECHLDIEWAFRVD